MAGFRGLCKKSFILDLILVGLLIYLVYVFIEREFQEIPTSTETLGTSDAHGPIRYEGKIRLPGDYRSLQCASTKYDFGRKVTLISYFNNFQLYDLKTTLTSALYKNEEYVGEIIVVDDGSNEISILENAKNYFNDNFNTIKLLRNEVQLGSAKSMRIALDEAKYEEIVFIDPSVVCSDGWLLPLLDEITRNINVIAVPHFDKMSDSITNQYEPVQGSYVASVLWNLQVVLKRNDPSGSTSPGLRSEIFATRKSYLNSIGSIDDGFNRGGGDIMELGMRIWSCGGLIKVVECSRVGLINFHNSVKITSGVNLRRIVGIWFRNNSELLLPISKSFQPSGQDLTSIRLRKQVLSSRRCRGAHWYFKEILKKRVNLDPKVVRLGFLRVKSGICAQTAPDLKINLVSCEMRQNIEVKDENFFQLTSDKKLVSGDKCVRAEPNSYVSLDDCRNGDWFQHWEYTNALELVNFASKTCATHVTDPDNSVPLRQIIMVQSCSTDGKYETFQKWTFLPA